MASDPSHLDGFIYSLNTPTIVKISSMLNPTKVLLSDEGYLRDWRGLAELAGCDMLTVQNLENSPNPCSALIKQMSRLSVNQLIGHLEKMDRHDVIDDTIALMENDLYQASRQENGEQPIENVPHTLTIGDLENLNENGNLVQYDVFVLYSIEDQEFVDQVVAKMEGEYGLKLCLKDRDLMAGLPFEHQALTELISNRCRFVLPIFSPNFLNSEDNKFLVNFSEALGIERGCRKIVPCVYKQCDLPKSVRYYTRLDFTRQNQYWDPWDKMRKSLTAPPAISNESLTRASTAPDSINSMKKSSSMITNGNLVESNKYSSATSLLTPAYLTADTTSSLNEISADTQRTTALERKDTSKNWLKKMWKKSKQKTADKQKVRAVAI